MKNNEIMGPAEVPGQGSVEGAIQGPPTVPDAPKTLEDRLADRQQLRKDWAKCLLQENEMMALKLIIQGTELNSIRSALRSKNKVKNLAKKKLKVARVGLLNCEYRLRESLKMVGDAIRSLDRLTEEKPQP